MLEARVDLMSNDMTWRQMIGVGVRNVVLARGELDKVTRGANIHAYEAARARDRQTAATSQNEAEESDESEDETAGERTTRASGKNSEVA